MFSYIALVLYYGAHFVLMPNCMFTFELVLFSKKKYIHDSEGLSLQKVNLHVSPLISGALYMVPN